MERVERPLMSENEFKEYLDEFKEYLDLNRKYVDYSIFSEFKSVKRAIKRGLISDIGEKYPKRPFNNRANTCKRGHHSRATNELKKKIYGQISKG